IGEISAAHAAGILTLPDAAALITARARLMQALPAGGAMLAAAVSMDAIEPYLDDQIAVAAINTPTPLLPARPQTTLDPIAARLRTHGHRTRWLHVSHAFHSPLMDPALGALSETAAGLTHHRATIPVISATTGQPLTPDTDWPTHWANHARNTVNFAQ